MTAHLSAFAGRTAPATSSMIEGFRTMLKRRAERRRLQGLLGLDEHLLRDIGLTRGDVAEMIRNPAL